MNHYLSKINNYIYNIYNYEKFYNNNINTSNNININICRDI